MSLITIEDINSINLTPVNEFYELDTGDISEQEFYGVLYDFCVVSHSINGTEHTFDFEIHNSLWAGEHYFLKSNDDWLDITGSYNSNTKTLTVTTTEASIKIGLYLCSYRTHFNFYRTNLKVTSDIRFKILDKNQIGDYRYRWQILELNTGRYWNFYYDVDRTGVSNRIMNQYTNLYVLILLKKNNLVYDLSETTFTVGKINHVNLNVNSNYIPNGSLTDTTPLNINVQYGDKVITVEYDDVEEDYVFDLDLRDKIDNKPVNLTVTVDEAKYINKTVEEFNIVCEYPRADSYSMLKSLLVDGAETIELTDDIEFDSDLIIPHNVYIIGNNHQVYLLDYNIDVGSNTVKCESIGFENGAPCFIQRANSKLILNKCTFNNAMVSDNYKGSVVSSNEENTITELDSCNFINCHHSIYLSGELKVSNCKAKYDLWSDNVDTDYSAFATVYDGVVEIINSVFDIDYDITDLCSNELDIKFAQSLLSLGENTTFNGINTINLKGNDSLPFFNAPFNNLSHVFARYYYPQITTCVITSPVPGKEDQCVCHNILGNDWVYKNNVQVTRVESENENNIRKINIDE